MTLTKSTDGYVCPDCNLPHKKGERAEYEPGVPYPCRDALPKEEAEPKVKKSRPTTFSEAVAAKTPLPAVDDIRADVWREVLVRHHGNITHAGFELGFSQQRGSALCHRHDLMGLVAELKAAADQPRTGRPKGSKTKKPGSKAR